MYLTLAFIDKGKRGEILKSNTAWHVKLNSCGAVATALRWSNVSQTTTLA